MAYTRVPSITGSGGITNFPTSAHPIPVSDPATTNYHPLPGTTGIVNQPPAVVPNVPSLTVTDISQSSGTIVAGDTLLNEAVTDDGDGLVTTGVDLYESGVLVGAMVQGPAHHWKLGPIATTGSLSYVARRNYASGFTDSAAVPVTVVGAMSPDQITTATLLAWFRVPESIGMGGSLEPAGTGPPAVTITSASSLNGRSEGVLVDIIVGGARGTATFTVYIDNGTTPVASNVTTAATYLIPGTDLTLNFPIGTYNSDNSYRSICANWLDKVGAYPASGNNFTNATSLTRPYIIANGDFSAPCIRFDGSNDRLVCTGTLGSSADNGADKTSFRMFLTYVRALPLSGAGKDFYCVSNLTDTDLPFTEILIFDDPPVWRTNRRSDTGATQTKNSNVAPGIQQALVEDFFDGNTLTRRVSINSADVIGGDSGVSGVHTTCTITTTTATLGARNVQTGFANFLNFDLYEQIHYNTRPSDAELARLRAYFLT